MQGYQLSYRPIRVNIASKKAAGTTAPSGPSAGPHPSQNPLNVPENKTVFVFGIDSSIDQETLRSSFSPFGEITQIKVFPQKSFAFVDFATHEQAENTINQLPNGAVIGLCTVKISWGKPSPSSASSAPPTSVGLAYPPQSYTPPVQQQQQQYSPPVQKQTAYVPPPVDQYPPSSFAVNTSNSTPPPASTTTTTTPPPSTEKAEESEQYKPEGDSKETSSTKRELEENEDSDEQQNKRAKTVEKPEKTEKAEESKEPEEPKKSDEKATKDAEEEKQEE
eukprot:TRINITY_DN463_c0_g1_i1.p1 TRINITY_DN463_c0_g1~~TRINITY_DN463_c0_g1_i1.p1  ORF type:complete len:278 (-),score=127.40 TRINITY_DN463_c0_g1_i1:194-1027(-)